MKRSYFLDYRLLPAWFHNRGKRLIKAPKLQFCDTAILSQLLDVDYTCLANDSVPFGQFLENFVFSELIKQRSWSSIPFELYHFRDGDKEVDFVLERSDGSIIGIEVKSASAVRSNDLIGLKHLQQIAKEKFQRGIILYTGNTMELLGPNLWAVPIQALWLK